MKHPSEEMHPISETYGRPKGEKTEINIIQSATLRTKTANVHVKQGIWLDYLSHILSILIQ